MISGGLVSGYCVYLLRDKQGRVRYVGKGKPARVQGSAAGRELDYEIVAVNLAEPDALELEARLINLLSVELDNLLVPSWPRGEEERWQLDPPKPAMGLRGYLARVNTAGELRGFMARHDLDRQQTADLLGYSSGRSGYNTITSWLTGKAKPPPFLVLALAELERHLEAEKRGRRT